MDFSLDFSNGGRLSLTPFIQRLSVSFRNPGLTIVDEKDVPITNHHFQVPC